MAKSLTEIIEKLRNETHTPGELTEYHLWLSGEYAFWAGQLEEILKRKPQVWLSIRKQEEVKSDSRADKEYEKTEDGQNEIILKFRLKTMTKLMSAIRTRLEIVREEARNQF